MAYDSEFKANVKVDYEAGTITKGAICKKYRIPRKTLVGWSKEYSWEWRKRHDEIIDKVEVKAHANLVEKLGKQFEETTVDYYHGIGKISELTMKTIDRLEIKIDEADNEVSKFEGEAIFAQQKFLKIAGETLANVFCEKRKALGLDKSKDDTSSKIDTDTLLQRIESDKDE